MTLSITSNFDAGAIEVLSCDEPGDIRLRVRRDSHADFAQWFYFRLSGARGERCVMTFENAADCAFAEGWRNYQAAASYDRVNWFRVPTTYDGRVLKIDHTPDFDRIYYAYFEPYSEERHAEFLGAVQQMPHAAVTELGKSVEGRPMSVLTLGTPDADSDPASGPKRNGLVGSPEPRATPQLCLTR